jgi:hypothetical protein
MRHLKYKFISILASLLSIIAFFLLAFKVYNTQETDNIDYTILFLIISGQLLIFLNGILNSSGYMYIPAMIIIGLLIYVMYIKISNDL